MKTCQTKWWLPASLTLSLITVSCDLQDSAPGPGDVTVGSATTILISPSPLQPTEGLPPTVFITPTPLSVGTPIPTFASPASLDTIQIELIPLSAQFEAPVALAHAGDGSGWLYIVEKVGRIRIFRDGELVDAPFLDISDRVGSSGSEQGLLGLAFHPNYEANGFLYLNYTDVNGDTVISRFSVTGDPEQADPGSEQIVLTQEQPAPNHNGGQLAFGPDGYLYIGLGDGGGANDVFGNAQNGQTLLGSLLRIDLDQGDPYAIPADNPFVSDPDILDEIWAIGLRNPWRFSFDRSTGELYIGDVGQGQYEEIDIAPAGQGGQNYGWPIMEGIYCYANPDCDRSAFILPITQYDHTEGCAVTGGYVYRGSQYPGLNGIYFFGDYCSGSIWGLKRDSTGEWQVAKLLSTELKLSSFGEDENGELYALDLSGGALYLIAAPGS